MEFSVSKLCKDSHECARDKGWLESPRSSCDIMNLFVSELSEALEDYRANKGLDEIWYEVKYSGGTKRPISRADIEEVRRDVAFLEAKPCGIPIEIADFVIRLGEYCGTNKLELPFWTRQGYDFVTDLKVQGTYPQGFDQLLAALTTLSTQSLVHPQKVLDVSYLGKALALTFTYCGEIGIPLRAAIEEKHAYNLTRSHRHGGKRV